MQTESTRERDARAWIDVDLGALLRNARALAAHAAKPLVPMIKADAYGLGAVPVARALEALDPLAYGVATIGEGEELRAVGITRPVILFSPLRVADLARVRAASMTPTLATAEGIGAWAGAGGGAWHLAIDTGMHRAGVQWDALAPILDAVRRHPPTGAFTHFQSSELDDGSLERQEERFRAAIAQLPARPPLLHTQNSAGIVRRSPSPWDCVRPGIFLYGVGSGSGAALQPEPVVSLHAEILEVRPIAPGDGVSYNATWRAGRPSRIATIACGYADGVRRQLGNRAHALIAGSRAPLVGVVTMDLAMLDVTDIDCGVGDRVTLLGLSGSQRQDVEALAATAAISPYELLTGLRQRLPRFHVGPA